MGSKPVALDAIKEVVSRIAEKFGIERVYVFGSYARGEASETSDLDLHIEKGRIRDLVELAEFQMELEDSLLMPVDVLTTGALSESFLVKIKQEEVLIYGH